jgi:hypothetical protein
MKSPLKERPGELASKTGHRLTQTEYNALHLLQAPFGFVFWLIEQQKARLQDRIENERSAR